MYFDHMFGPAMWNVGAMLVPLFAIVVFWAFFWKGLALWHSAQRGQYWWFIVLLIVNTAGILEILYLFGVARLTFNKLFTVER